MFPSGGRSLAFPGDPSLHVEVSMSKALNPQLPPGRFTAAHCSSITKEDGGSGSRPPSSHVSLWETAHSAAVDMSVWIKAMD
ncbi:hypothetical protein EYF80_032284 [Liparis tanakae]|uniref:Uncharacterized protein n=1 Tax=Liparis tanakae TaxID=230148 RepID=A0A4Z2GW45_9TELE|nr:hypothetical protein EYF80_032284 [Liparis tanakae]